jgi:hypothetical protein
LTYSSLAAVSAFFSNNLIRAEEAFERIEGAGIELLDDA